MPTNPAKANVKAAPKNTSDSAARKASPLNRADGWVNILAGLGKRQDKGNQGTFGGYNILTHEELSNLWMGDGIGKRIVSVVADDMTRAWIDVGGDDDGALERTLFGLGAQTEVNTALKWARLYGGAIVVMGVEDGKALDQPAVPGKPVRWLKTYGLSRIMMNPGDVVADPRSPRFEKLEYFRPLTINGTEIKVHWSRCLVFAGEPVPADAVLSDWRMRYWGASVLQAIWEGLRNYGQTNQGIANLMLEFAVGKYGLDGLEEILASNNVDAVYSRMEIINASKSLLNAVLLGKGETFTRDVVSLSGVPEIVDRMQMNLCSMSGIPVSRLFGKQSGGLNNEGTADVRNYYDGIASQQQTYLRPPMMQLVATVNAGLDAPIPEDDLGFEFGPIWTPSQAEMVDMRKKQAETDKIYVELGVYSADEVTQSRFGGGYSFETQVGE